MDGIHVRLGDASFTDDVRDDDGSSPTPVRSHVVQFHFHPAWQGLRGVAFLGTLMTDSLVPRCEALGCDRPLDGSPTLAMCVDGIEHRAYECDCGTVTVTVARADRADPERRV